MTEWGVVGVIVALVGLLVTVVKPILNLNTSMVRLTEEMKHINRGLGDLNDRNTENHKRIWDRVDEHGDTLKDHEKRIQHLELENELERQN